MIILNIISSNPFSKVQVLDMMGKEILIKNDPNIKSAVINTSFLENGYYSIKISQGNQVNFYSFIKAN